MIRGNGIGPLAAFAGAERRTPGKAAVLEIIRYRCSPSALNRNGDTECKNHLLITRKWLENSLLLVHAPPAGVEHVFFAGPRPSGRIPPIQPSTTVPTSHARIPSGRSHYDFRGGSRTADPHSFLVVFRTYRRAAAAGPGRPPRTARRRDDKRLREGVPGLGRQAPELVKCLFRTYSTVASAGLRAEGSTADRRPRREGNQFSRSAD